MDPVFVLVFILGLCVGSFLNVLIVRLPDSERSILKPLFSACPYCSTRIRFRDNMPVLSYIVLRGRCRTCKVRISWIYPFVELLSGSIAVWAIWRWGLHAEAVRFAVFLWILLAVAVTDARTYLIPDLYTLGGAGLGLLMAFWTKDFVTAVRFAADGVVIAAALWLLGFGVGRIVRREALGFGDVLLVGMMACYLGFGSTLIAIYWAAVSGVVGHFLVRKNEAHWIPFGLHLAIGGALALVFPSQDYALFLTQLLPWH